MKINDFFVSIRKTKVVDIDKDAHLLPPDFGAFPEYKVADYNCPEDWSRDGYFIPVKEGQPLWIDLRGNDECACIMSVQRLNPITGKSANLKEGLQKDPEQNYMVLPDQKWIDGYVNEGKVYQFVITKAGEGLAVNEYLLPEDMQDSHAIGLAFFGLRNPKPKEVYKTINNYPYYPFQYPYPTNPLPMDGWYDAQYWTTWISDVSSANIAAIHTSTSAPVEDCKRALQCTGGDAYAAKKTLQCLSAALNNNHIEFYLDPISSWVCNGRTVTCPQYTLPRSKSIDAGTAGGNGGEAMDSVQCFVANACTPDTDDILDTPEDLDKASMGAGGRIDQEIITDRNTVEYYTKEPSATIPIYLALPEQFASIMRKGERQDASKPDDYLHSGKIGNTQVPLVVGR